MPFVCIVVGGVCYSFVLFHIIQTMVRIVPIVGVGVIVLLVVIL